LTAFQEALARAGEVPDEELRGMRFSVPEKMDYVLERARREGRVSFDSLFPPKAPKGEIIVTFLALLELLRQHRVGVIQNAAFDEITVVPSSEDAADKPLERPDDYE
jgi:segregation and condensation protein A